MPVPLHLANLTVDPIPVRPRSRSIIELRTQEFELLLILVGHPGRVFHRSNFSSRPGALISMARPAPWMFTSPILRKKLAGSPISIETVTGIGYKLVD